MSKQHKLYALCPNITTGVNNLIVIPYFILALVFLLASPANTSAQEITNPSPTLSDSHPEKVDTSAEPDLPNIVIFLIDTLRADRLGTYGYVRKPTSPNIDALARDGVVFEQACSPSPWTLPTVASLMTSTYPCEHQTLDDNDRLPSRLTTLPSLLKQLGYRTLGLYSNPYAGPKFGVARDYNEIKQSRRNKGSMVAAVLDRHPGEPFFFYIHNGEPHNPYEAHTNDKDFPKISQQKRDKIKKHSWSYRRMTREDFARRREIGTTDNTEGQLREIAELNALYDDYNELYDIAVHEADTYVGSVIDMLKERKLWDNTIFILLADHGEELSEHGGWLHDQSVYQELTHVPLVVHFPNNQYAGKRIKSVVSLVDVMPSVFDFLRKPIAAKHIRGKSFLDLLKSQSQEVVDDFVVPSMRWNTKKYFRPWKETRGDINLVVRYGEWKGIWNAEPENLELYNLDDDPWEQEEISEQEPTMALAMRVFAKLWFLEHKRAANEEESISDTPDSETLEGLRQLGYID